MPDLVRPTAVACVPKGPVEARARTIALIPGTSSVEHLRENVAAANLVLPADAVAELDTIHLEAAG
jgi:aryl-alcohol dehydrogenase-like predicted oxidoreductase